MSPSLFSRWCIAPVFGAALILPAVTAGAEQSTSGASEKPAPAAQKPPKATAAPVYKPRLPNQWGKLGINAAQRQRIYAIRVAIQTKIRDLEAEIEQLREDEDKQMRAVLASEQIKRLDELLSAARARRSNRATRSDTGATVKTP